MNLTIQRLCIEIMQIRFYIHRFMKARMSDPLNSFTTGKHTNFNLLETEDFDDPLTTTSTDATSI